MKQANTSSSLFCTHLRAVFLLAMLFLSVTGSLWGQGCSDAGFCTINSFKPHSTDSTAKIRNQVKAGISYGSADHSIAVIGAYVEYNRQLNDRLGIDFKTTALSQNGKELSAFGLSDVYLNVNYNVAEKVKMTVGTKIPLTNGNRTKDQLPLPMDYQASLGTFDLILGMGYEIKNFQLVAALQQPLSQNKNAFLAENRPVDSPFRAFQSTNRFKRSGDVLVRVSYPVKLAGKWTLTPSVLPIYHLRNDAFTDAYGIEKRIEGSEGLTLNGNVYLDFDFNQTNALQLSMGTPFIVREARPDGLTRHFVLNLEYKVKF